MKSHRKELRVGIFVFLPVFLLIIFIIVKLGYSLAGSTYDVYLKLDNIKSVKEGTSVKIKGYTIGRVVDIVPVYEPELNFFALMRIKREISIYEDCKAIISNQNVIGDTVIELRNPEKKIVLLRHGAVLKGSEQVNLDVLLEDAHRVLVAFTGMADDFKNVSRENRANIRLLVNNLNQTMRGINLLVNSSDEDLKKIIKSIRETTKNLQEASGEFKKHPVDFLMK